MPQTTYDWLRFWCPREGRYSLSDGGFLFDPDSELGSTLNPDAKKFEEIAAKPCLVLLGEPGIGKTHEIKQAEQSAAREAGDQVLQENLRAFQTDTRLCAQLFESDEFMRWKTGTHCLYLFLDSLDEGIVQIKVLAALLEREFGRCDAGRLRLRIACRTADWPHSLEKALKAIWGDANVGVYELLPLRRRDVRAAAAAEGIDPIRFMEEVDTRGAVPLAIKPVTLRMLINLYREGATLPTRQAKLYEEGCRLLCEESNRDRRESGAVSDVPFPILFAVACRIAAVTVFANRYAIWMDIDEGNLLPEDVSVRQLRGGTETIDGERASVTEHVVRETLKTGLFTSRGPHRLGWAHQTYAEFLAARYVVASGMTHEQVMSLIVHPDDPGQKLVPQLHETAAWIAGMRAEVFQAIMDRDPEVLLRSDVAAVEPEDRKRLVDSLLALYAEEKFTSGSLDLQGHYHKLAHLGLADQLRPHLLDKNANWLVQRVTIDIVEACEVEALVPELVRIALDQTEQMEVRKNAAYAVVRAGDAAAKAQLKPLALGQAGPDPNDDLKGCGLQAVWPEHMTAEELFQMLTPRKQLTYGGSYSWFRFKLRDELPKQLQTEDLRFALDWVARGHANDHDVEGLGEWIIVTAWEALEQHLELAQPLARAALTRLRDHDLIAIGSKEHPFSETICQDHARRRRLLAAAVSLEGLNDTDLLQMAYTQTPLVIGDDVPWLTEQLKGVSAGVRRYWGRLIEVVFDRGKVAQIEMVLKVRRDFSDLADLFPYMDVVKIGSERARKMRADYLRHQRAMRRIDEKRNRPVLSPPPKERVLILLDKFEGGDRDAWWQLNMEMTLEPDSRYYGNSLQWDLTALPGWRDADEPTRTRIIRTAADYVASPPPMDQSWLGTNTLYGPACAGYRALALLHEHTPGFLDTLPPRVWAVWAPIVIAFPLNGNQWNKSPHTDLVRLVYRHAPDSALGTLNTCWWESGRLDHCWDDRIAAVLLYKARALRVGDDRLDCLLAQLLRHNYEPAIRYAQLLTVFPPPSAPWARARAKAAALALLTHHPKIGLQSVWPSVRADAAFGREIFESLAHHGWRHDATQFAENLSELDVADLYLWLSHKFPHAEDPRHDGAYFVGPRDSVIRLRDELLNNLRNRGTREACEQVRRIVREVPDVPWLRKVLLEAEDQMRRHTWQPPRPEHIIALTQDRQRRYIENGQQLLDVLIEALEHLQDALQGENPAAVELWDNRGNTRHPRWCPVDELRLSDWLARRLREDLLQRGIVVNREVQIRRGQETDIHVDAVNPGADGETPRVISAIIEVKGCWDPELETAMETQLVGRYLQDNQCSNGLYLVGWFNCELWSDRDYRKKRAPTYGLAEARERFARQASELQNGGAVPQLVMKAFVLNACLT